MPTLLLFNKKPITESGLSRSKRLQSKDVRQKAQQVVSELLATASASTTASNTQSEILEIPQKNPSPEPEPECSSEPQKINYKAKYMDLLDNFNDLIKKYSLLKASSIKTEARCIKIDKKNKILNDQLRYFKTKYYNSPKCKVPKTAPMVLLKTVLTQNQIDLLSKKKKRVNWTREEIAVAFTLRYYSKKCYLYLRTSLNYPLPSLSSLRRWASELNLSQGILKEVLLMLKLAGESFSPYEKTVVLQYDEVKVKAVEEYNVAQDEILGPYNYMQVVMARGLFSNWKQPIFIAFDTKITQEILFNIITELHHISFNVVACVSDCGASNVGLWKVLGVDIINTSFKHPISNNNIYMFADVPHLLKLLRNWLLDKGFKLKDNSVLNKNPLQALVALTDSEVNACWKINQKHIDVEKTNRQNVRLAAQLLSNNVSTALLRYKPGEDKVMAENLGHFIGDIDLWFDIFNSYVPKGTVPSKNAYGINLKNQNDHLKKMYELIYDMRVVGKNTLMTFQKGMLMSIISLQKLFEDMKTTLDIKYICTHKLNQDSLENFFFQIRSRGGPDEHPTPLGAIYRMRMILLGKNPGILTSKVNTEERVLDEYIISTKVLKTAQVDIDSPLYNLNDESKDNSQSSSSFSSVSSSDSKAQFDFNLNAEETSDDALEYIAGYLAKKYKTDLPNLGDYTYKFTGDHNYSIPSWVQQLSYGGLIKPSAHFKTKVKKWNFYFESHHGDSFRKGKGVVQSLAKKIFKTEKELPLNLVKDFCKLRTIIRMNFRNLKAKFKSSMKRRSLQDDNRRKKIRKFSKIVK